MASRGSAEAFVTGDDSLFGPGFAHGNTYAGHPLACAAVIANLKDPSTTEK